MTLTNDPYENAPDAGQGIEGMNQAPSRGADSMTDNTRPILESPPHWWEGQQLDAYRNSAGRAVLVWLREVDPEQCVELRVEDVWDGRGFAREDTRVWFPADEAATDGLPVAKAGPLGEALTGAARIVESGADDE